MNQLIDRYVNFSSEYKYKVLYQTDIDFDMIILGSSHAEAGINPKYLERDDFVVYNFAYSGASIDYYHHWYDAFQDRLKNTSVVILSVDWFMFDSSWLWRKFEHDSQYFSSSLFLKNLLNPEMDHKALMLRRFPLDRMHFSFIDMFLSGQKVNGYYRGYYDYMIKGSQKLDPVIKKERVVSLDGFVQRLVDDGKTVVFVQTPEQSKTRDGLSEVYPEMIRKGNQEIQTIAEKYDIPFLNFNTELHPQLGEDQDNFLDWGHLNHKGSPKFSKILARELKKHLPQLQ